MSDIKQFCAYPEKYSEIVKKIPPDTLEFLVEACFACMFQKVGDIDKARRILIQLGYLKQIDPDDPTTVTYVGDLKGLTPYQQLERTGVAVIPIIPKDELSDYRSEFKNTLREFPEYDRDEKNPDLNKLGNTLVYALGGFGALGNPASFHNPFARNLRQRIYTEAKPFFEEIFSRMLDEERRDKIKLQIHIDRMLFRRKGQKPSAESWHRDMRPKKTKWPHDDETYGGWVNLNDFDQTFSCIPGTHLGVKYKDIDSGQSFSIIPKDKIKLYSKYKRKFKCPPGHEFIFPQYIIHEVYPGKLNSDMYRLHTIWRTSTSNVPFHHDFNQRIKEQAIIPLPSGQLPPVYSANHGSLFLRRPFSVIPGEPTLESTIQWSNNTFLPKLLIQKPAKGDNPAYKIIPRFMKSLEATNLPKYPPYTKEELRIYELHRV